MPRSVLLERLFLSGWKSIGTGNDAADITFGPLTVLIGPNGAGKSNLISFFRLLNWMTPQPGNLQFHIGRSGGANALLHDSPSTTLQVEAQLRFRNEKGTNEYECRLFHAAGDTLIFADERMRFTRGDGPPAGEWKTLGAGHRESKLLDDQGDTARCILWLLRSCVVHQFHNTSDTARIRQRWDVNDNRFLKEDGANLAPVLFRLSRESPEYYQRILKTIRLMAPFIADLVFEPEANSLLLQWRERGTDRVFASYQASDGTLRMMALVTLLLQPSETLPPLIILDEPELGLHPYAIEIVGGLLRAASQHAQVIVATQSPGLLGQFDAGDVVVVDRADRCTTFTRLSSAALGEWLNDYSIAELWEKNVLNAVAAGA